MAMLDLLGVPAHLRRFEATHHAARQRLGGVNPSAYARSRNALDGAVTGLSPYFTHGLVGMAEAAGVVNQRQPLTFDDKLVFEFAWREFFHHVWWHQKNPDAILQDMHGLLPWSGAYTASLPQDIRQGCTGVPAIDNAVRILYATGYLHNHMRMWLASYVVHVRKVHWRAGADWLFGHLLDGDLASNHLSWQWVAATFSSKPYLFNAENVLKYAPASARPAWDCGGTHIDQSYEALDELARRKGGTGPERGVHDSVVEPPLLSQPCVDHSAAGVVKQASAAMSNVAGQHVQLVHPWSLSQPAAASRPGGNLRIGVIHLPAHAAWPWSQRRWEFVLTAMASVTDSIWMGDLAELDLSAASSITAEATLFPGYRQALQKMATLAAPPRLLPNPSMACRSFSKFYERARRDAGHLADLL